MGKREDGVYYTSVNPFWNPAFVAWSSEADLPNTEVLEPFAGGNFLIDCLISSGLCQWYKSFDISPTNSNVRYRDTLADFPTGFIACITNPPWLAKNSATRRGLPFPDTHYDDIYKFALSRCLDNCPWVCALVPESFIRAGLFHSRLDSFVSLTGKMFADTDSPVGLALFGPKESKDFVVWRDDSRIGYFSEIQKQLPEPKQNLLLGFNCPSASVGLIAIDGTKGASIRFCHASELKDYPITGKNRAITKIAGVQPRDIQKLNEFLTSFRENTQDVLLTSFKGIRKDGMYRRRLDWKTARRIINHIC